MSRTDTSSPAMGQTQRWVNQQSQFEASGLTVKEFCHQNGIATSTFYKRLAILRASGHQDTKRRQPQRSVPVAPTSTAGFIDAGVLGVGESVKSHQAHAQQPASSMSVAAAPANVNDQPPDVRIVVAFNMCVAGATRK